MAAGKRVLVTGADGLVGGIVMNRLHDRYDLRPLTHEEVDIADAAALRAHVEGIDAVVHLAAAAAVDSTWETVLPANVVGVRNVYEAARAAGVGLVVFASSNHAVGMYQRDGSLWTDDPARPRRIDADDPVRPASLYGASKAWGEALGRFYAETTELRVICLRIGWVTEDDRVPNSGPDATLDERRARGMWLSHADCASLVAAALDAPGVVRWGIVYGVSNNPGRWFDLEAGRRLLGWEPRDSFEERLDGRA
jgi:nucleoside-diphosphate-sugar epimerase